MKLSRRCVAAGGVLTFATVANLVRNAQAQGGDEAAVNQAIEDLRKAMMAADKAGLEVLVADQLTMATPAESSKRKNSSSRLSRTKRRSTS